MGKNTKREALDRLKVATCAAQRLGDLHTVIGQEVYSLANIGVSTASLALAAEYVDSARKAANAVARQAEAVVLGKPVRS